MVGALIIAFSNGLTSVLFGRFILGFAVSLSAISECIYIAEISIPNRRGGLVSLNELGITVGKLLVIFVCKIDYRFNNSIQFIFISLWYIHFLGILVSFLANYCLADVEGGWRVMFGMSAVAAIIQAVAMCFLPKVGCYLELFQYNKSNLIIIIPLPMFIK